MKHRVFEVIRRPRMRLIPLVIIAVVAMTVSGCQADSPVASADPSRYTAIIDVRTPTEFDSGHVEGARNIDVMVATFAERIAELPADGTYLVYCRSGSRSAQAAAQMREIGLDVVDGGGLGDMSDAGYPITG